MDADEVQFLRDQVQRLNTKLAEYQQIYPPLSLEIEEQVGAEAEGVQAPWLLDKQLMSPLLAEYDGNLSVLKEHEGKYKQQIKELRSQVDKLVVENRRLTKELKDVVEKELENVDTAILGGQIGDEQIIENLQQQVQLAQQEKDSAMGMWQAAVEEIERLEHELQSSQFHPRVQSLEQQANQIKDQYVKTVTDLNQEITLLQQELRTSRNQQKASQIQVNELRQTLEALRLQICQQEQEKQVDETRQLQASDLARSADSLKQVTDLQDRMTTVEHEKVQLHQDKNILEKRMMELQKKSTEHEQKEYEAMLQVRESVQLVENAMLEKDQALVREQQAHEENQRLQDTLTRLLDEAGARTRVEVDNVKKQCNQNIERLMEEIHSLEMESSEKQAQVERAVREKRTVESELEKIYQDGLVRGSAEGRTVEELNSRACHAERLKDEAMVKLTSVEAEYKRAQMSHRQEKQHLEKDLESTRDRLTMMNQEFENVNDDRVKLLENLDELKRQVQKLKQEKDGVARNFQRERACQDADYQLKEKEFEVKLQATEEANRHALMEIRQMLASSQRMSAKWKEECQSMTHTFETKIGDLRSEVSREKKRNEELNKLLRESREKVSEAEKMLMEYTRNIKRLEGRVKDAEERANQTSIHRNKQMLKESIRRQLQDVPMLDNHDQLKSSFRTTVEPLAMSDLATTHPAVYLTENSGGLGSLDGSHAHR